LRCEIVAADACVVESVYNCDESARHEMTLTYIDGSDLRAAELRRYAPGLEFAVAALQTGFSTSDPAPAHRASDKLIAAGVAGFAEAADLLTAANKSMRLELDSENENRFCRHWRETQCTMMVSFAMRATIEAPIQTITVTCAGQIADKPAGPFALGWDRLFRPTGSNRTLAELCAANELPPFREEAYRKLVHFLTH
jgi:hypothetical protein